MYPADKKAGEQNKKEISNTDAASLSLLHSLSPIYFTLVPL